MNSPILGKIIFNLFFFVLVQVLFLQNTLGQSSLPKSTWNNVKDYTFMYFPEALTDGTDFHIQTNHHFLAFDYRSLHLKDLRLIENPQTEEEAVRNNLEFLPLKIDQDLLKIYILYEGKEYKLAKGSRKPSECFLIESGKFFQRRNLTNLRFEQGAPIVNVALEVTSWPDRISFVLKVTPKIPLKSAIKLKMDADYPNGYSKEIIEKNDEIASLNQNKNGFVFSSLATNKISKNQKGISVISDKASDESITHQLVLVINSVNKYDVERAIHKNNITVKAKQIAPLNKEIKTSYNEKYGWNEVHLANDIRDRNGIVSVILEIENHSNEDEVARLDFSKDKVNAITGISAILRDIDQNPTGIPVQLSKNWHKAKDAEFKGSWFRGFSMITVPANQKIKLEFTLVNAYWGKILAASHAQLCLAGWGNSWGNGQLWDQSAIGAFGESICYEPDGGQASTMITDQRPLMIKSIDPKVKSPSKWGWTSNVGGADFFRLYDESGEKKFIKRIKTHYKRYCPNLTEVTYAGTTFNESANYELTTSIYRSDDYVRGIYKIKLQVKDTLDFDRLVIVQIGSETYSYTSDKKFAIGDENGLIEEWETKPAEKEYVKTNLSVPGQTPWISLHDNINTNSKRWGASAARGFIVKSWNAVVQGKQTKPYFSEFGNVRHKKHTSLAEINLYKRTKQLLPGDFIEAEIVQILLPSVAESYYGPNETLKKALQKHANSWQMVYREAVGNTLDVRLKKGTLLHSFPLIIEVNKHNEAIIDIKGGVGYVPVTFKGITDYKDYNLQILKNGVVVNLKRQEEHGKDFWQADFDPVTKTWDITYSVFLD